jgi:hypothetical protein
MTTERNTPVIEFLASCLAMGIMGFNRLSASFVFGLLAMKHIRRQAFGFQLPAITLNKFSLDDT